MGQFLERHAGDRFARIGIVGNQVFAAEFQRVHADPGGRQFGQAASSLAARSHWLDLPFLQWQQLCEQIRDYELQPPQCTLRSPPCPSKLPYLCDNMNTIQTHSV
jgi:hypothetical protein